MSTVTPTRVVIADDSALMRLIVSSSLTRAGMDVVGNAANGDEALVLCERERPDVLTLDLTMPGRDGISVLRELRARGQSDLPVVVVSAFSPSQGARAVDALAEGAFDLVAKPAAGDDLDDFVSELTRKLVAATYGRAASPRPQSGTVVPRAAASAPPRTPGTAAKAVVIATSTGGPRALGELLPMLPSPLGLGTLIVQHMPAGFTHSLASRLDSACALSVREARDGESLHPEVALLAPGGRHLRVDELGHTRLTDEPEIGALRPRADLTIADVATRFGDRTVLVVMTGMGQDGLLGAREVRRHGGRILVEAESSCTVYGMPRAVKEARLADDSLPLQELAGAIAQEAAA